MSTTATAQKGLRPVAKFGGSPPGETRKYQTYANNRAAIFKGDAVFLLDGGKGGIQVWNVQASAGCPPLLGVVVAVYDSNGKPFTHSLPSGGPFIPASTAGFVMVDDDPSSLFIGQIDVSAGGSFIGQFCTVSAGAPVTAAGISGAELTGVVATAAGQPFQIIGLSQLELDELGGTSNKVIVRIANHQFARTYRNTPAVE